MGILVGVAVVGLLALVIWAAIESEKRRKQRIADMQAFAGGLGLSFFPGRDASHDERYAHFELFRRGFARAAYNTIRGEIDIGEGVRALCDTGDFTYKTRETYTTTVNGKTQTRTRIVTHRFSYFILELPYAGVPDLLIRREGLFDKIASAFGKNDIDFESAEFSRKYFVKCDSRKFAYDVIHPRMIEFLLETRPGLVDMENGRLCLADGYSVWPAERFRGALGWTLGFLERWPDFVVKDLSEGRSV